MFWLGDSREVGWKFLSNLHLEFWAGIRDNIPVCCVITYVLCILASLITKKDGVIFEFVYRDYDDWLNISYWRCPLCKSRKKVRKIKWGDKGYS